LQANSLSTAVNTTIVIVEQEVGNTTIADMSELENAKKLLNETQVTLTAAEDATRRATDAFGDLIFLIGSCAIACAILGLVFVLARVRSSLRH
jgi:hypothetical protein